MVTKNLKNHSSSSSFFFVLFSKTCTNLPQSSSVAEEQIGRANCLRRYETQLRCRTFNCSPRGEVSASAFRNSKGHTAPLRHTASTCCILLQLSPPPFLMLHSRTAIVPTRFIVSISHLIVVILCLMGMVRLPRPSSMYQRLTYIQDGNVLSGLALAHTDGEFTTAKARPESTLPSCM